MGGDAKGSGSNRGSSRSAVQQKLKRRDSSRQMRAVREETVEKVKKIEEEIKSIPPPTDDEKKEGNS